MTLQNRLATIVGHEAWVEVYVCDAEGCDQVSTNGMWWVQIARMGIMSSMSDPLAQDRHFCSVDHAATWLSERTATRAVT